MQDYLTTRELAALAQVNQSRIRQVILAGELKAEKRGRDLFIARADAQAWLDSRKSKPPKKE